MYNNNNNNSNSFITVIITILFEGNRFTKNRSRVTTEY